MTVGLIVFPFSRVRLNRKVYGESFERKPPGISRADSS